MPFKKNQDLTDMVKPEIMPIEHSGGDGWTILHGDAPRIIRSFRPGVFDAVITDPPYASGGWKPSEKNRTTNQKYSSTSSGSPEDENAGRGHRETGSPSC